MKKNKLNLLKLKLTPLYQINTVKKSGGFQLTDNTLFPGETFPNTVSSFV